LKALLILGLLLTGLFSATTAARQQKTETQLPPELHGAKVYSFPERAGSEAVESPVIYKKLSYEAINFERLLLNLYLSITPVERSANIRRLYFQDIRVNGVPIHVETFDQEFKLSKTQSVDLPAPLKCSIVFSELDSLKPIKEIIEQDKIRITGQSFIEVKLNTLEKIALRTKQLVLPIQVNEDVPLKMFSDSPLLQAAAVRVLSTLSDPSTSAAALLAKAHLAKLSERRAIESAAQKSVYLLYCEYKLRDPKTRATETFSQSGTGFTISSDGKLLTAKRVVQAWKFDPQIAFLMKRHHLEMDPTSYKLLAWPAGARVLSADGQLDFQAALSTDKRSLRIIKAAPDRMVEQQYQDPDSGRKVTLNLHSPGENDAALLQLAGIHLESLAVAEPAPALGPDLETALLGFPFGLSKTEAVPQPASVTASVEDSLITLDHALNPGESGAPLLTADGKVIAMAGGAHECIPIGAARASTQ